MSYEGQPGTGAKRQNDQTVYEQCSQVAYQVAIAVLGFPADAEDIAQEACLVVFTELEAGKQIDDVRKYASTIAYHKAIKAKRRAARWTELSDEHAAADSTAAVLSNISVAAQAIASLTRAQRLALCLHFGQGMTGQEVGEMLDIDPRAAVQLANRGRAKAQELYADLAATRSGMPADCAGRGRQIWQLATGRLDPASEAEVREHLSGCLYCRETHSEIGRDIASVLPLLPTTKSIDRDRIGMRPIASRRGGSRWSRRRLAVALSLLVLALLALLPGIARRPSVAIVHPAADVASGASVAAPTPAPTPTPVVVVPGSFAYVSGGDVYYSRGIGQPAARLTNTGGAVDALWWAPDGRSIVYKQAQPRSQVGDLHEIDLQGRELWSASVGAVAFAFAPDGRSYVVAIPLLNGRVLTSYQLVFAPRGAQPSGDAMTVTAIDRYVPIGQTGPVTVDDLSENPPVLWSEMPFAIGLRWARAGLHFQCSIHCGYDIDPNARTASWNADAFAILPARAYVGPAQSAFALAPPTITASGRAVSIAGAASVVLLSVSPDGQTALANYARADGGHGIAVVGADGSVTQLTSDTNSILGLFQPIASG